MDAHRQAFRARVYLRIVTQENETANSFPRMTVMIEELHLAGDLF